MANDNILRKLFSLSPHIEMLGRRVYWFNIQFTKKWKKNKNVTPLKKEEIDTFNFSNISKFIRFKGVSIGDLLVVHSAFGSIKRCGLPPSKIIDELLDIVGEEGTLAMPAMPKFKNTPDTTNYLKTDISDKIFEYNVQKSKIKTGLLPTYLHRRKGAIRSRHPINTMVAFGPLAEKLMETNLVDDFSLACGTNSSWKKCVDHNAYIVGIGVDLTHSLTMIHVAEDMNNKKWPIKNWYRKKKFRVIDNNYDKTFTLQERNPKWGALHFAERTLFKDLISNNILTSTIVNGVTVEIINSKKLIYFLNSKNSKGYPYFWTFL